MNVDKMIHNLKQHRLFLKSIQREFEYDEEMCERLNEASKSAAQLEDALRDMRDEIVNALAEAHRKALAPLFAREYRVILSEVFPRIHKEGA